MAGVEEGGTMIGGEAVEPDSNISGVDTPYVRRIREVVYISEGLDGFIVVVSCMNFLL